MLQKENQLEIRQKIEHFIEEDIGTVLGSGTDLTSGIMDVSFIVYGVKYSLTLKEIRNAPRAT